MRWSVIIPLFALFSSPFGARANDEAELDRLLDTSSSGSSPASPPYVPPAPAPEAPTENEAAPEEGHSPPVVEAASAPRSVYFNLDEDKRFGEWMREICNEAPVESMLLQQRKFQRNTYITRTARNKQGSLLILLENYVENLRLKKQGRTVSRDPAVTGPQWLGVGEWKFESASPHPKSLEENLQRYHAMFKAKFPHLRELGELNGDPATLEKAERIVNAIKDISPCQTRASKQVVTRR